MSELKKYFTARVAERDPRNKVVSVRQVRGTSWVNVVTSEPLSDYDRGWIAASAVRDFKVGQHFTDSLPGADTWEACIHWKTSTSVQV